MPFSAGAKHIARKGIELVGKQSPDNRSGAGAIAVLIFISQVARQQHRAMQLASSVKQSPEDVDRLKAAIMHLCKQILSIAGRNTSGSLLQWAFNNIGKRYVLSARWCISCHCIGSQLEHKA